MKLVQLEACCKLRWTLRVTNQLLMVDDNVNDTAVSLRQCTVVSMGHHRGWTQILAVRRHSHRTPAG